MRESNPIAFYITDQNGRQFPTVDTRIAGGLRLPAIYSLFADILQQITVRLKGNEFMRVFDENLPLAQMPGCCEA